MIVARLNQHGGVGKTTLALHLAGVWACQCQRVAVIDADPQGCALDWFRMRTQEPLPKRFTVIGLVRNTLHREAPKIARDVDRVIVNGLSYITALTPSVSIAADLALVPVQPPLRAATARTRSSHTQLMPIGGSVNAALAPQRTLPRPAFVPRL